MGADQFFAQFGAATHLLGWTAKQLLSLRLRPALCGGALMVSDSPTRGVDANRALLDARRLTVLESSLAFPSET
ncbi:hypothetical protein ADL19_09580 [Streptomyces purpurogeneiscleroticus]|nr:hypothetical protein ADL19_09580 [Streptomyces purpurogeneiscleroticus]